MNDRMTIMGRPWVSLMTHRMAQRAALGYINCILNFHHSVDSQLSGIISHPATDIALLPPLIEAGVISHLIYLSAF